MSRARWVLSLLLVCHVGAMVLASVPSPERITPIGPPRYPAGDPITSRLTPLFDTAAATVARISGAIWATTRPLHRASTLYVSAIGLEERWNMFVNPDRTDRYVRVRYYVRQGAATSRARGPIRTATELVFPGYPEDRVRLVRSYWIKYRDKAISIALDSFIRRRDVSLIHPGTRPGDLPDDLAPVARFFAKQYANNHLREGERIVRTEVWAGTASNPPRGEAQDADARDAHLAVLHHYYGGPVEERPRLTPYPPYYATEREGDIEWVLEYFETDDGRSL
jgi:hypothetical protein